MIVIILGGIEIDNIKHEGEIQVLDENSVINSDSLLINKNDIETLIEYYLSSELADKKVVLFRFANTDYYSESAYVQLNGEFVSHPVDSNYTYVAQQTVFFDFDVIELTFNKDGKYMVIPVVASPIDIIGDFNPPPRKCDWLKLLIAIIALILLVWFLELVGVMPLIKKLIWFVITAPFKFIKWLIDKFRGD